MTVSILQLVQALEEEENHKKNVNDLVRQAKDDGNIPQDVLRSLLIDRMSKSLSLFKIDGRNYYHNYGHREAVVEKLVNDYLGKIKGIHGVDIAAIPSIETKTMVLKSKQVNLKTKVGMLDKINRKENKEFYKKCHLACALFDQDEKVILCFMINSDDLQKIMKLRLKDAINKFEEKIKKDGDGHDALVMSMSDFVGLNSFKIIYMPDNRILSKEVCESFGLAYKGK